MASSRFVGGPGTAAAAVLTLGICIGGIGFPTGLRTPFPEQNRLHAQAEPFPPQPPSFARMLQDQAKTDRIWREASVGHMQMTKIAYRSSVGDLDIPAFVFQPLTQRGARAHPAIVWVHENIRGHLYEHYIPYIREATASGFVVIAPEYRGSIGYGKAFYDAIDYGGAEVDDVVTAASVLATRYPQVDPSRIGDHRLEPRRHDHAAVGLPEPDDVQGGRGDRAGDQSVSAAGVEGGRAAAAR